MNADTTSHPEAYGQCVQLGCILRATNAAPHAVPRISTPATSVLAHPHTHCQTDDRCGKVNDHDHRHEPNRGHDRQRRIQAVPPSAFVSCDICTIVRETSRSSLPLSPNKGPRVKDLTLAVRLLNDLISADNAPGGHWSSTSWHPRRAPISIASQ